MTGHPPPELSVIIPTRNRPERLRDCLQAILAQTLSRNRFEVLVVDNGTAPGAGEVVSSLDPSNTTIRYLSESRPGLHRGRHAGMKSARADNLVFGDDDIIPTPTWLEAIAASFGDPTVALVGGKNLPKWEAPPPVWIEARWRRDRKIGALSILDLGEAPREIDPNLVWGCNFSIRRPVLIEAGGFHPDAMPEELIHLRGDGESHVSRFISKRGYRARYEPLASVFHFVGTARTSLDYFRARAYAQGITESFTSAREPDEPYACRTSSLKRLVARVLEQDLVDGTLRRILPFDTLAALMIAGAHRSGFEWHQALIKNDPSIREWVMKRSFLDD